VQKLHLVGVTTDHRELILSTRRGAKSGSFVVSVDDELLEVLAGRAAAALGGGDALTRPASALSVREVQARIRAGRSIESVAAEAGVDIDWVSRFAIPVLAEQAQVVAAARAATFVKARGGPSAVALGDAVSRNLADKRVTQTVDEHERGWAARQLGEGTWLVTFSYLSRGKRFEAAWEYEETANRVIARDRLAAQLAFRQPSAAARTATRSGTRRVTTAKHVARSRMAAAAARAAARDQAMARQVAQAKAAAAKKAAAERERAAAMKQAERDRAIAKKQAERARAAAKKRAEREKAKRAADRAKAAARRRAEQERAAAARAKKAAASAPKPATPAKKKQQPPAKKAPARPRAKAATTKAAIVVAADAVEAAPLATAGAGGNGAATQPTLRVRAAPAPGARRRRRRPTTGR
jgi:flagellar biosynthesis GTPase FlhF